jgi:hypothetical protein
MTRELPLTSRLKPLCKESMSLFVKLEYTGSR